MVGEEELRKKQENRRKQELNISQANMVSRPQEAKEQVQVALVDTVLGSQQSRKEFMRHVGTLGRHFLSMATLSRGNEVKAVKPCNMSTVGYPVTHNLTPGISPGSEDHSMDCLVFSSTLGKGNPGDRVDLLVTGRHKQPLMDAPWYVFTQPFYTFHVVGSVEVTVDEAGGMVCRPGRAAPDLYSKEWRQLVIWYEGDDPSKPISSNTVMELLNKAFQQAGIDTVKKQHFGRKYHLVLLRTAYGTPLADFDNACGWANNVKEQYYAMFPARDLVANAVGFPSADCYYIPRADLKPGSMPEFKDMVNRIMPWLGSSLALVTKRFRNTAHGQRDFGPVDAAAAMAKAREWWFQTLPFFWRAFPDLPLWDMPVIKQLFASGVLERWCQVQLTYCDCAQRCLEMACEPAFALQLGRSGNTELVMQMVAGHMQKFRAYVMGKAAANPAADPAVRAMALRLNMNPQVFVDTLTKTAQPCTPAGAAQAQQQQQHTRPLPQQGVPEQQPHDQQQQPGQHQQPVSPQGQQPLEQQQQQHSADDQPDDEPDYAAPEFDIAAAAAAADGPVNTLLDPESEHGRMVLQLAQQMSGRPVIAQAAPHGLNRTDAALQEFSSWMQQLQHQGGILAFMLGQMQCMQRQLGQLQSGQKCLLDKVQRLQSTADKNQEMLQETLQVLQQISQQQSQHSESLSLLLLGHSAMQDAHAVQSQQQIHLQRDFASLAGSLMRAIGLANSSKHRHIRSKAAEKLHQVAASAAKHADMAEGLQSSQGAPAGCGKTSAAASGSKDDEDEPFKSWPGDFSSLSALPNKGIAHLRSEWKFGIVISHEPLKRTQSVRDLEANKKDRQGARHWRAGKPMRQLMSKLKPLYLAIERRIHGHPPTQQQADVWNSSSNSDHCGTTSSSASVTEDEAVEDLEVLARLLNKENKLNPTQQQLSSVAARKGLWPKVQKHKPAYGLLEQYLREKEWPTEVYESKYWEDIYGTEDPFPEGRVKAGAKKKPRTG